MQPLLIVDDDDLRASLGEILRGDDYTVELFGDEPGAVGMSEGLRLSPTCST